MDKLKFRNSKISIIFGCFFVSIVILLLFTIGSIMIIVWEDGKDLFLCLNIAFVALIITWAITILCLIMCKTVVITNSDIKMYAGKKLKWCIKREDILECIYHKMCWYSFINPIASVNSFLLQFKLKGENKISNIFCSLSFRQIKMIKKNFGYPIRVINTIYEQ